MIEKRIKYLEGLVKEQSQKIESLNEYIKTYKIGQVWELDETDWEIINSWRN